MDVIIYLHAPATLSSRKHCHYQINGRLGGPRTGLNALEKRKYSASAEN
jgi:hypothetical protein